MSGRAAVRVHGIPERIKHQTHSAAPLTIIKMPRLKGDIPNLRLFVSIKCIPRLWLIRGPPLQEQCIKEGVARVNGNSIHFIKPTGPTIPETFNFASVTSKETFLSPLCLPSPHSIPRLLWPALRAPAGPQSRYGWAPRQFWNRERKGA